MSPCESCSMPIETGRYCVHCTDERGQLQPFDERFARMVAWQRRRQPAETQEAAERATLAWMATMPAWKDHPGLQARRDAAGASPAKERKT